jgi:hypothetical protein
MFLAFFDRITVTRLWLVIFWSIIANRDVLIFESQVFVSKIVKRCLKMNFIQILKLAWFCERFGPLIMLRMIISGCMNELFWSFHYRFCVIKARFCSKTVKNFHANAQERSNASGRIVQNFHVDVSKLKEKLCHLSSI